MAILNITLGGASGDAPDRLDDGLSDAEIKRIAFEIVRNGEVVGLHVVDVNDRTFESFVVDRHVDPDGTARFYLRPKVPFGASG